MKSLGVTTTPGMPVAPPISAVPDPTPVFLQCEQKVKKRGCPETSRYPMSVLTWAGAVMRILTE